MTLTAVIPTIGRPEYFDQSLGSILEQDRPFDQIVVFDNSGKGSVRKSSSYADDPRVEWHISAEMLPALLSWNTAVGFSKSEFTTICGDDDIFHRTFSQAAADNLSKGKMVYVPFSVINSVGAVTSNMPAPSGLIDADGFRHLRMRYQLSLMIPGIIFRTNDYLSIGGFIDSEMPKFIYSDDLLWFRLSQMAGGVAFCEGTHWAYRVHEGQIGRSYTFKDFACGFNKFSRILDEKLSDLNVPTKNIYPPELGKNGYIWKTLMKKTVTIRTLLGQPSKGILPVLAANSYHLVLAAPRIFTHKMRLFLRPMKSRLLKMSLKP